MIPELDQLAALLDQLSPADRMRAIFAILSTMPPRAVEGEVLNLAEQRMIARYRQLGALERAAVDVLLSQDETAAALAFVVE